MAVDLMGERLAFREAAAAGLRSLELLASSLSPRAAAPVGEIAGQAVAGFRRAINLLDRTGHARFRRAPVGVAPAETDSPPASPSRPCAPVLPAPKSQNDLVALDFEKPAPAAATSTSFLSSVTAAGGGEGSVSKGQSLLAGVSSGKPPLPKRKHPCPGTVAPSPAAEATTAARPATCHCSGKRRRKHLTTRTVRVPASSRASTDVPSDEHSWRKYGQKPIKGSPFPRGYYRCSAVKGCPARKHVERDASDPATLVVTYEGDHRHDSAAAAAAPQAVA